MKMNLSVLSIALLLGLLPIVSVQADTYVIGPGIVVFDPGQATRVGTTSGPVTANAIAGRVPITFGATTVNGTFTAPTGPNAGQFSGGGTPVNTLSGGFGGFFSGTAQAFSSDYYFSPTIRSGNQPGGVLTATAQVTGATNNFLNPFTLVGASVGPEFRATGNPNAGSNVGQSFSSTNAASGNHDLGVHNLGPTGTINLGAVDFVVGPASQNMDIAISNGSDDASFVNVPALVGNQADLNILGISITGPDSAYFSLDPAQVTAILGNSLSPQEVAAALTITFQLLGNDTLGVKTAYLTILTDQFGTLTAFDPNNPNQLGNQYFVFQLTGVVNPEPASLLAWGLIAGAGAVGYRLRKRKVAIA